MESHTHTGKKQSTTKFGMYSKQRYTTPTREVSILADKRRVNFLEFNTEDNRPTYLQGTKELSERT